MKKLLIIIVGLVLVIGGGIKGFLWWSVKSDVDSSLAAMRVKAEVNYDGVGASLGNEVTLTKALIKPAGSRYEFLIDELSITPKTPEDLEDAMRMFGKDVYPAEIEVSFKGLHIDLTKPLPRFFRDTPVEKISLGNMLAYGCGKPAAIDTVELQKMGYQTLSFDGGFNYRYDPLTGKVSGDFNLGASEMAKASGQFSTNLPSINSLGVITGLLNNKFRTFNISITDAGFHQKYIDFCTKESKLDKAAFVKAHIARMKVMFARFGISFNDAVWSAIAAYQTDAGSLSISFGVPKDVEFSKFQEMKPEAVAKLLSLDISHNNKTYENLGVGFNLKQYATAIYENSYEGSEWRTFVPAPVQKKRVQVKKREADYHVVSFSNLRKYKGRKIKVTSNQGMVKEGILKDVQGKQIYISRQIGAGEGVFKVYSYDTKKIEVFF